MPMGTCSDNGTNVPQIDNFSSISLKYRFLFGLTRDSRILIVGHYHQALLKDIKKCFHTVHFIAQPAELLSRGNDDKYELICIDCCTDWSNGNIAELLIAAKAVLNASGSVVIAAANRYSLDSIFARIRRKSTSLKGYTFRGYVKNLKHA